MADADPATVEVTDKNARLLPAPKTFRERWTALHNLPPFLALIWQTSPRMTVVEIVLRLARALLPIALLYVGKLILDSAIAAAATPNPPDSLGDWLASGKLDPLMSLLGLELGLAIVSDALGRAVRLIDTLLAEKVTNETSLRLMRHAATLDLKHFEDADIQDALDRARRQTIGRMTLMSQVFGQAQDAVTIATFAVGLIAYEPWLLYAAPRAVLIEVQQAGRFVAASARDGEVFIWDDDGVLLARAAPSRERIVALHFTPDLASLVTGGWDGRVAALDLTALTTPRDALAQRLGDRWGSAVGP